MTILKYEEREKEYMEGLREAIFLKNFRVNKYNNDV